MSFYFILKLRIFMMMRNINDVYYFILETFVMIGSIEALVMFDFYVSCSLFYCIL